MEFIVEKDGSLSNIEVVKGITSCAECDAEALRLMETFNNSKSNAPKWSPGKQKGKSVRVKMVLPIAFM